MHRFPVECGVIVLIAIGSISLGCDFRPSVNALLCTENGIRNREHLAVLQQQLDRSDVHGIGEEHRMKPHQNTIRIMDRPTQCFLLRQARALFRGSATKRR